MATNQRHRNIWALSQKSVFCQAFGITVEGMISLLLKECIKSTDRLCQESFLSADI